MTRGSNDTGLGTRLRACRERVGLSREALAFHSGISWSAIAQVESGRRTNLRPSTLLALAKALGVTIDYLVSGSASSVPMLDHRALLYETESELFAIAMPFLEEAIERSEPALAVMNSRRIRQLRLRLGSRASHVELTDWTALCSEPVAAIERFHEFLNRSIDDGASWVRVLGELVWAGCSDAEVRRWSRFESLLNLAFSGAPMTVLCAYNVSELDPEIIGHARATHPHTVEHAALLASEDYCDPVGFVLDGRPER